MPWRTAATFGAVAAIRCSSWLLGPVPYLSWHGWLNGLSVAQFSRIEVKPMSLPAICSDTTFAAAVRALNCGGFVPASVLWGAVMSAVVAPLQETSASDIPTAAADRWAKLWSERRHPSGESDWFGISGPAA